MIDVISVTLKLQIFNCYYFIISRKKMWWIQNTRSQRNVISVWRDNIIKVGANFYCSFLNLF